MRFRLWIIETVKVTLCITHIQMVNMDQNIDVDMYI